MPWAWLRCCEPRQRPSPGRQAHWYWLAEVNTGGEETLYGPVRAGVGPDALSARIYLPLIERVWR